MEQGREQKMQEEKMRMSLSSNSSENTIVHAMTLDSVLQQTADYILCKLDENRCGRSRT